jgi:Mg-chelatase subunit ChlD
MGMNESIVKGSVAQIAKDTGKSIAETFLNCDIVCLIDTSGSMSATDSLGGKSRYQVACDELAKLQGSLPGKIAVISFSDEAMLCPGGKPFDYGAQTKMDVALNYAKIADVSKMRFILISDGEPNDEDKTLTAARKYKNKIDTIYVGPEEDRAGQRFLEKLAKASGGQAIKDFKVNALETNIRALLA